MNKGQEYYNICCLFTWNKEKIERYCQTKNYDLSEFKKEIFVYIERVLKKDAISLSNWQMNFLFSDSKQILLKEYAKVIKDILAHNPNLRSAFLQEEDIRPLLQEYFFNFLKKAKFNRRNLVFQSAIWDIKIDKIISMALDYALDVLKYSKEEVRKQFGSLLVKRENTAYEVLKQILFLQEEEVINNYLATIEYDARYLKTKLVDFLNIYIPLNKRTEVKKFLLERLNAYENALKKQDIEKVKEQEKLQVAEDLIKEYLASDNLTLEEFCSFKGITRAKLTRAIALVKQEDKELYQRYRKKIEVLFSLRYDYFVDIAKKIIEGLEIEDAKARFTILDYLSLTQANLSDVLEVAKRSYLRSRTAKLEKFVNKYKVLTPISPKFLRQIFKERVYFSNLPRSLPSVPDSDNSYLVLDEDKEAVLLWLKQNNLYYEECFDIALRRYIESKYVQETPKTFTN